MKCDDDTDQAFDPDDYTTSDEIERPGDQRFWKWTALGLATIAFAKGMRQPNLWSYTQAQLNYDVGFMRRGLFGWLLGRPLALNHYANFAVLSTVLLLVLYGVLLLLTRTSRLGDLAPPGKLLAVYASSYSVTYFANLNGYLDIPLALLCLGPLFIRRTGLRLMAGLAATIVGILIHEEFFFAFVPLLAVSVAFGATTAQTPTLKRRACAGAILLAALGIALTWYMGRHASISEEQTQQLATLAARTTDRPLHDGVFGVLPRTPKQNLQIMESVWKRPTFIPAQVESFLLFGPTAALLSWATLLMLREWRPQRYRWLYAGTLLATLAPLSLNLVGWDKNRWNQLVCFNAFLMLLFVSRMLAGRPIRLPLKMRRLCLLVMLLNMATGNGLMDDVHIRPFPFMRNPNKPSAPSTISQLNQPRILSGLAPSLHTAEAQTAAVQVHVARELVSGIAKVSVNAHVL
ncbi:MAG TPA: hypothetical protein VGU46_03910 [Acidobacteriaceae bacterium]|nr:hypothetical protein [Acidobacteriaceae bacterium]